MRCLAVLFGDDMLIIVVHLRCLVIVVMCQLFARIMRCMAV